MNENEKVILPDLFEAQLALQEKIKNFKKDWYKSYKNIGKEKTPQVDGSGKKIRDFKGNYEYIIAAYMVECLDKHFPGWSWERSAPLQFLGTEWVVAQGTLCIIDEKLLAFGIQPPYRRFYGCGAVRVTYPTGAIHTIDKIIDINNNVKGANTEAMKVAINRLTHIGDDVYGKRIEEEGAGSLEDVVIQQGDATSFGRWVTDQKLKWSFVFEALSTPEKPVKGINDITEFVEAIKKIKEAKGWS